MNFYPNQYLKTCQYFLDLFFCIRTINIEREITKKKDIFIMEASINLLKI